MNRRDIIKGGLLGVVGTPTGQGGSTDRAGLLEINGVTVRLVLVAKGERLPRADAGRVHAIVPMGGGDRLFVLNEGASPGMRRRKAKFDGMLAAIGQSITPMDEVVAEALAGVVVA